MHGLVGDCCRRHHCALTGGCHEICRFAVALKPGVPPKYGRFQKLLRLDEMPKDMTRFRLDPSNGPDDATFKAATGNKFLGATSRKK